MELKLSGIDGWDAYRNDKDALWLMAQALLDSALRGEIAKLPGAEALARACVNIVSQIEKPE